MRNRIREFRILESEDPELAFYYAWNIIKGRWIEAEPFIMKDPELACWYAKNVIKGRWQEAEYFIMKNPIWAYEYARGAVKGRWAEAEPFLLADINCAFYYSRDVIRRRWSELETKLFDEDGSYFSKKYCKEFETKYTRFLPLWLKYHTSEKEILKYFR